MKIEMKMEEEKKPRGRIKDEKSGKEEESR